MHPGKGVSHGIEAGRVIARVALAHGSTVETMLTADGIDQPQLSLCAHQCQGEIAEAVNRTFSQLLCEGNGQLDRAVKTISAALLLTSAVQALSHDA